jgi:hypothetical protein
MLNKKETFATLQVLKQGRAEMVQDFLDHKPEIYTPSFKYEDSPALLSLAREKYFMTWLSSHWQLFSHEATFFNDKQKEMEAIFATVFLKLLGKWAIIKMSNAPSELGTALLEDMQNSLELFINAGDNAEAVLNDMKIARAKAIALYNRKIKQLKGEAL